MWKRVWLRVLVSRVTTAATWSPVCTSSNKWILVHIKGSVWVFLALTPFTANSQKLGYLRGCLIHPSLTPLVTRLSSFLLVMLQMYWRPLGGSQWWCHIPTWWLRHTALWLQHSAHFWDPHASVWSSRKILRVVRLHLFSRSSSHCCCHWPPGRQRNLWSFYSAVGGKDCVVAPDF